MDRTAITSSSAAARVVFGRRRQCEPYGRLPKLGVVDARGVIKQQPIIGALGDPGRFFTTSTHKTPVRGPGY